MNGPRGRSESPSATSVRLVGASAVKSWRSRRGSEAINLMLATRPSDESAKCWALATPQQPQWGLGLSLSIYVAMWHWMTQENTSCCTRGSPLDTHSWMPVLRRMTWGEGWENTTTVYLYSLQYTHKHWALYGKDFTQMCCAVYAIPFHFNTFYGFLPISLSTFYGFLPISTSKTCVFPVSSKSKSSISAAFLWLSYWTNVWIYLAAILTVVK